jgi:hypothetical protein
VLFIQRCSQHIRHIDHPTIQRLFPAHEFQRRPRKKHWPPMNADENKSRHFSCLSAFIGVHRRPTLFAFAASSKQMIERSGCWCH